MTVRIAVLDDYQRVAPAMADWAGELPAGTSVDHFGRHIADEGELVAALAPFEVVVAMRERTPFPRSVLAKLPRLRLLVTTGMVNASIDLASARELGVTVCGTRSRPSGTAELTWALILGLVRDVAGNEARLRAGQWQTAVAQDLYGETLGVVGLGRLGGRVAAIGAAFGMDVVAWSPRLTAEAAAEHGARLVDKAELFATAKVATIHLVLGDRSRGLVGAAELGAMREDAYLVNTSRFGIIDADALRAALTGTPRPAGVALDVFDTEPLPEDHWLRSAPRTLLSPHMGFVTAENYRVFYGDAVADIAAFLADPSRPLRPLA
ncbi:D-2-hydroxyacid dehydrogenase family protein [Actinacidiphila sp. ITFR-21]|uniref:D-2-hydroxyacid dehydrogenase family protein n=1 Tax=Actinacidiphila sp. ITFR-21 TaxID=3075199 RepID=UPI00288A14C4|nr:D-2-hydroxyacid dehydrogenase family protein [Streptomyces sp. ITFR-21]WNI16457.1 D-2-hydroxyacid dehydrogenase family protein [Streptomyces sp. ITFR-21]